MTCILPHAHNTPVITNKFTAAKIHKYHTMLLTKRHSHECLSLPSEAI